MSLGRGGSRHNTGSLPAHLGKVFRGQDVTMTWTGQERLRAGELCRSSQAGLVQEVKGVGQGQSVGIMNGRVWYQGIA